VKRFFSYYFFCLFSIQLLIFVHWFKHANFLKGSFWFTFIFAVNNWTSSLIQWLFDFFYCSTSNPNTMLNKSTETRYHCLVSHFRGNRFYYFLFYYDVDSFFSFFGSTGIWTKSLTLFMQVPLVLEPPCHLIFCDGFFKIGFCKLYVSEVDWYQDPPDLCVLIS
jgi:hypothetical protein